jgi:hypothetical protein
VSRASRRAHPAGPLRIRDVLRMMGTVYRHRFGVVAGMAAAVFGFSAVFDAIVTRIAALPDRDPWVAAVFITATSLAALGTTFYAGLLDEVVGGDLRGEPSPSLAEVVRTLPWGRLLVADLVITAVTIVFTLGFVVIGALAFTLMALVGPIINIEGHGVRAAFRRSARLVLPHFVVVFLVVTVPIGIEHAIVHAITDWLDAHSLGQLFLANAVFGIVAGSFVGLAEVVIAYTLIIHDHVFQTAARAGEGSPAA